MLPLCVLEGDFPSPLKEVCQLLSQFESPLVSKFNKSESLPVAMADNLPLFKLILQILEMLYTDDRGFCLSYLSIFPENSVISCKRLSRLWAAEGFLRDSGEAEGFFNDLLDRKCIHVEERSDGELSTFRVDNLVREIILSLSDHHNLVKITGECESGRYLSVQGTIKNLKEEKSFQLSSIFALDVSSNEDKMTISEALPVETSDPLFPFNLKHSKVLDLTGAPFQIVPNALFELTDVWYLSLTNMAIKVIPSSIGKLMHLEYLDAKHTLVTELPPEVSRLEKIRRILIYHYKKDPTRIRESYNLIGFKASCSLGGLLDLEKLCFVEADERTLEDLGNLTKLRRLGITKLRADHVRKLCSALAKLKKLTSLNVHALDEHEIIHLHDLSSPPELLKHLYLHGRLEKLPYWISSRSLEYLTKLVLRWSHLEEDVLATLGELPELVELELRRAYDGEQLDFKEKQFTKLKILLLEELQGLRSMSLEQEALPSLESLTISRCGWLEEIPPGILDIHKIRKLAFLDMSDEFYEKVKADHEKDNYKKFEHIEEVYFTRWRAGHWKTRSLPQTKDMKVSQVALEYSA